jgi:hypothetical protein
MNPFAIRNMEHHERISNYRLSRARRVVENVFGILAHKFRVLLRTMNQRPDTCRKIITTCVILHNFIRLRYPATHNNLMDLEDQNQNEFCIYEPASSSLCLSLPGWHVKVELDLK